MILTIDEIRTFLGITDYQSDDYLTGLSEGIQGRFDSFLQYPVELDPDPDPEFYDIGDSSYMSLRRIPIEAVTEANYDPARVFDAGTALVEGTDYTYERSSGIFYFLDVPVTRSPQSFKITYSAGWESATLPESLRRALLSQIRHEWTNRNLFSKSMVSDSAGGRSQIIAFDFLPDVLATLTGFRRMFAI